MRSAVLPGREKTGVSGRREKRDGGKTRSVFIVKIITTLLTVSWSWSAVRS